MISDLDAAVGRSRERWSAEISHVDIEAAYRDRSLLAAEVLRLRTELAWYANALARAEADVDRLVDQS